MEHAERVVDDFRHRNFPTDQWSGEVVTIAAVWVSQQGRWGGDVEAGVLLEWRQEDHRYALLMPMSRLIEQAGSLENVATHLWVAVDEPHGPSLDGGVLWFEDLPSS
jgi:hypothetical protein